MRHLLAYFLFATAAITAIAGETFTPVEGMGKELYIWAFPNEKDKEKSDIIVYSKRELVSVWLNACCGVKEAKSVPIADNTEKLFAYRLSESISAAEVLQISLLAYDASTKSLIRARFNAEEKEAGIKYSLESYEYSNDSARHIGFDPRLVETSAGSKKYTVNLYTMQSLEFVNVKEGKTWASVSSAGSSNRFEKVYRLNKSIEKKEGQEIEVRGKLTNGKVFVQKFTFTAGPTDDGEVVLSEGVKTELTAAEIAKQELEDPVLRAQERTKKIYGGAQYSAQEVAQARAEHMNTMGMGTAFHIGWDGRPVGMLMGMIPTAQGQMWEGVGWGGGGTCSNGKQLIAEGRSGPFLVRFFTP